MHFYQSPPSFRVLLGERNDIHDGKLLRKSPPNRTVWLPPWVHEGANRERYESALRDMECNCILATEVLCVCALELLTHAVDGGESIRFFFFPSPSLFRFPFLPPKHWSWIIFFHFPLTVLSVGFLSLGCILSLQVTEGICRSLVLGFVGGMVFAFLVFLCPSFTVWETRSGGVDFAVTVKLWCGICFPNPLLAMPVLEVECQRVHKVAARNKRHGVSRVSEMDVNGEWFVCACVFYMSLCLAVVQRCKRITFRWRDND